MRSVHFFLLLLAFCQVPAAAQELPILIKDASTKAPIPFAAIRLGATGQGVIADLYGKAVLPGTLPDGFIEITALGYEARKLTGMPDPVIFLKAKKESLAEVVVRPDDDKIRRIINTTVSRRDRHNPEHYDWYRCHVYYKMVADAYPRDKGFTSDTSKDAEALAAFLQNQHLLLSETYSIRSWKRPQKLQEEVIGSRFSGFKKSMITGLVTDVLPFHAYTDYVALNGKDYRNPVSRGSGQWYSFNLRDELLQGSDTVWIISFFPKRSASGGLRGTVYIHSADYAIANFIGSHVDTVLGNSVRVEQQYGEVAGKWFPRELNYVFHLMQKERKDGIGITLQGSSRIDSVSFVEEPRYRFDKLHTVKLRPAADQLSDESWNALRPASLDAREARTYVFMDSLMESVRADRFLPYLSKLVEAKLPIGPMDINLERLYANNRYEGSRLGLGMQTNEKVFEHLSLGAWAGYGTRDVAWKYGGFAEIYLDPYKESTIRIAYEHDLRDPGRVRLHRELDRNYLRNYLISRADLYDAFSLTLRKRLGYFQTELSLLREEVVPQYNYAWLYEGASAGVYSTNELSLGIRYAFAERSAPLFGRYLSTGSKYPIVYAKVTQGQMDIGGRQISYTQGLAAIAWQKHIARIGTERWLVEGGKSISTVPLPLGKLFAGAGLRNDSYHLFLFGGLQTIYPYTYFSDAFLSWSWRHDFDWKLYDVHLGSQFSSAPGLALVYNGLWGDMEHSGVHNQVAFSIPRSGYHEGGVLVQNMLRLQYMQLYYIGLTLGYFYPINMGDIKPDAGTYVIGASISL